MPFSTIKITGGVNTELTPVINQAGLAASNLIRFKGGQPQKLGGWGRFYPNVVANGAPRELHAWEDLESVVHLAVGGVNFLKVITQGVLNDITPQFSQINAAPNFTTIAGSTTVNLQYVSSYVGIFDTLVIDTPVSVGGIVLQGTYAVLASHGPDNFDIKSASPAATSVTSGGVVPIFATQSGSSSIAVNFPNHGQTVGSTFSAIAPTLVGGITIEGFYTVAVVTDANNFSFQTPTLAASTDTKPMNGGNVSIIDWEAPNVDNLVSGFGIGLFGIGSYGAGVRITFGGGPVITDDWSLDNWGELLIACPKGGPIFVWGPSLGFLYGRVITTAPIANGGVFVAMPEQILVSWGAAVLGLQDPLLVRWCDVSDYNDWVASATNQAGSFRIPRGSMLVGGMQGPQQGLLWTDLGLWSMSYVGYPLVFGFNEVASGCGLIGQHAAVTLMTAVFWMSQKGFFVLSGGVVQPIDCPVWDVIFQNLNTQYASHIRAAANAQFNEVQWFFPSTASTSGENDTYIKLNTLTGEWDYGSLSRSAWIDQSVLGSPIGASSDAVIYQHEISPDADGAPMDSWFETGEFMLSEGEDISFVDYVLPDFKYGNYGQTQGATMQITMRARKDASSAAAWQKGPFTVTAATMTFDPRIRGRLISLRVESNDLGSFWRLGGIKFRYAPDGRNG